MPTLRALVFLPHALSGAATMYTVADKIIDVAIYRVEIAIHFILCNKGTKETVEREQQRKLLSVSKSCCSERKATDNEDMVGR